MAKFKVKHLQDDTWQVVEEAKPTSTSDEADVQPGNIIHQGSLADCYAWIMLEAWGAI